MNRILPLNILLVEDDPGDQKLIKASVKKLRIANDLRFVNNAEEALALLHSNHGPVNTQPDLILLDLNMPGMGGKEFLRQVKGDEILKEIPIVILTSSNSERDIVDSYRLQAAGFVRKPATVSELERVMGKIEEYWLDLCRLPTKEH